MNIKIIIGYYCKTKEAKPNVYSVNSTWVSNYPRTDICKLQLKTLCTWKVKKGGMEDSNRNKNTNPFSENYFINVLYPFNVPPPLNNKIVRCDLHGKKRGNISGKIDNEWTTEMAYRDKEIRIYYVEDVEAQVKYEMMTKIPTTTKMSYCCNEEKKSLQCWNFAMKST